MNEFFTFDKDMKDYLKRRLDAKENNLSPYATKNTSALREKNLKGGNDFIRDNFSVDVDKILHNALYNRYTDKTQVFSFYKNDDITRRALHVQLVSRLASIIGNALNLNLDLIEAIALGHDIGHTPFGHKGEEFLSELYYKYAGKYFNHNVNSIRVLKNMTYSNLTLQTYDGILCHCGEKPHDEYRPSALHSFEEFNEIYKKCYKDETIIKNLKPCTLEGCVVRISDMIAYIGKDRQDASKANLVKYPEYGDGNILGSRNTEMIHNIIVNIIKNSIDKPYLKMDKAVFDDLVRIQKENNELIYQNKKVIKPYYEVIKPMMKNLYDKFLDDIENYNFDSPVYKHHLNHSILGNCYRMKKSRKIIADKNDIIVDYISSMTDDYFIDIHKKLFPDDPLNDEIHYITYFD